MNVFHIVLFNDQDEIFFTKNVEHNQYTPITIFVESSHDVLHFLKQQIEDISGYQCELVYDLAQLNIIDEVTAFAKDDVFWIARVSNQKTAYKPVTNKDMRKDGAVWIAFQKALDIVFTIDYDINERQQIQALDSILIKKAIHWLRLHDLSHFLKFIKITTIHKGWSFDEKFCVTLDNGVKWLIRISKPTKENKHLQLFNVLSKLQALHVPMCQPIEVGICKAGVYSIYSWIEGQDADVIAYYSKNKQYTLGYEAGVILKKIHMVAAPSDQEDWKLRFTNKTKTKIKQYQECNIHLDGDTYIIQYLEKHFHLLENRPQSFQHGDYHIGNMMIEQDKLVIIDFDRFDFGDPWEEFNRIVWCAQVSPHFATGMIDGYFACQPPILFWQLLAFYIGSNTLSSIAWSTLFGESEKETILNQAKDVLLWFDNMNNLIPTWYIQNYT